MVSAIGIDIGGTKIAGGVVDEFGRILERIRVPSPATDSALMISEVARMANELRDRVPDAVAVGVAAAGFVDASRSTVYYAPNISWRDEPFRERLSEFVHDIPIVIDNDANAAGWAEFRFGAAAMHSDMCMLTIGTGVGGAIVASDRLLRGGFGCAGELGHMRVVPGGLLCGCGAHGCLEQYGSGRALERMVNEVADAGGVGAALAARRERDGGLSGTAIGEMIAAGDEGALAALRHLARYIGEACASFGAVFDPQIFVFGGGVAQAGNALLDPIQAAFDDVLPARGFHPRPEFAIAQMQNDAGMIGMADLARDFADHT